MKNQWKVTQVLVCLLRKEAAGEDYKSVYMEVNKVQKTGQI